MITNDKELKSYTAVEIVSGEGSWARHRTAGGENLAETLSAWRATSMMPFQRLNWRNSGYFIFQTKPYASVPGLSSGVLKGPQVWRLDGGLRSSTLKP